MNSGVIILLLIFFVFWIVGPTSHNLEYAKIYFLHAEKYRDRKKNIEKLIEDYHLKNAIIFPGVDGEKLDKKKYRHLVTPKAYNNLRRGQIGCALGHVNILRHIINSKDDHPYYVIFEDDVKFHPDIKKKFRRFVENLPKDFEFGQIWHTTSHRYNKNRKLKENKLPKNQYVQRGYPQTGTVGYMVTKKGAHKLLKLIDPITSAIDNMYLELVSKKSIISYVPVEDLIYIKPTDFKSIVRSVK